MSRSFTSKTKLSLLLVVYHTLDAGLPHCLLLLEENLSKYINLLSRMEEISHSSVAAVELPAAKDTATREMEDNIVETEEELGIFQLLDRLEEVTSMLTSR